MDKQFNVKELLFLMVLTMMALLLSGCGGSDEGGSASSSTPPLSNTRPTPDQGDAPVQLERLTLTAYPLNTKGASELTLITGNEQSFLAVGEYSNGQSKVLTEELAVEDWQSSDTELGEFIQSGVLKGKASGVVTVSFSQGNLTSNSVEVTVTDAIITDIAITPSAVNLAIGQNHPLVATATYSNGLSMNISDSVTWLPIDTNTATVTPDGQLTGVAVGTTSLTAVKGQITSNRVNVNVSDAVLTAINVTPAVVNVPKGQQQTLTANALYSDGTSSTITDSVVWRPVDTSTATITSNGVLSGGDIGTTTLTATKDGITSNTVGVVVSDAELTSISVTPPMVTVAKGQSQALRAIAIYSDNTSSDISDFVNWSLVDNSTATVGTGGQVTGVNVGATSLTAIKDGITSNSVSVDVSDAVITDISVIPSVVHVAKGQHQTLTANAIYSDNTSSEITDSVSWRPVNTNIATINPEGQVSGVNVGTTTLAAVKDGVTSHSVGVVVSDAVITSISVTPAMATIAKGQEKTLTATATYSDNTSTNISNSATWVPIDTSVATITSNAVLSGIKIGTTTLTAVKDGVTSHTVGVEVSDAVITDISVTPTTLKVAKGQHQPLTATAIYSDHTSSDVTDSVTWLPVDTSAATVNPEGQVTGVNVGTTTVTAAKDNITSNIIDVDITDAVMTDLTLMPPFVGMPNIELTDTNMQIHDVTAIATYSDGTTSNVTDDVTWSLPVNDDTGLVSSAFIFAYNLLIPRNVGKGLLNAHLDGFLRSLDVGVCSSDSIGGDGLARECIFLFKIPNEDGRIFASTPSVDYLDRLGLSRDGDILYTTGKWGHDNDRFYVFTWEQADAMCARYSGIYLGGRTNWRLIRSDEVNLLHSRQTLTQLPNNYYYWTSTKGNKNGEYLGVYMEDKTIASHSKESSFLTACVSDRIE